MTSRELTSCFDLWSRGHLCMAVMHLHIKFGAYIFIQSGVIDNFLKFKMASAAVLDFQVIGAVSGNEIIKINLLLHAFPVVTAKERNVISIAYRHRSVHDGHNCRGTTGQWS